MNAPLRSKHYEVRAWTIEDLVKAIGGEVINGVKFRIPDFQRTLVWTDEQRKSLVRSLKDGLPIGTLLVALSHIDSTDKAQVFSLLDGLQRTDAMKRYVDAPNKAFDREEVPEYLIKKLLGILDLEEDKGDDIRDYITRWVKSVVGFREIDGYSAAELAEGLAENFNGKTERSKDFDKTLREPLPEFLEQVRTDANILNNDVPIIFYYGDQDKLPTVFENLNSKGTTLTKYQIFAATWHKSAVEIQNSAIVTHIKKRYQSLVDAGYSVEGYEEDEKVSFNYFDYLFGFGKLVGEKYPELFGQGKEDATDSIGFNLFTVCAGLRIGQMRELPSKLDNLDLTRLEDAILRSIDFVARALKPYITLNANRKRSVPSTRQRIYHSEYQIVFLVAKVLKTQFDEQYIEKPNWENQKSLIAQAIAHNYLFDILRESWRGSGDSRIAELLDKDDALLPIKQSKWESAFETWFLDVQMARKEKDRSRLRDTDYLFLNYIYTFTLSNYSVNSMENFEVEHIVSIEKLRSIAGEGIAMGCVANLCLLPAELNREKQGLTIYEYYDDLVKKGELSESDAKFQLGKIEQFSFTNRKDLNFVNKLTLEKYNYFLADRFLVLKQKFYKENAIEDDIKQ